MYFKKTLVLSALDSSSTKAVVNVEKFKNRMEGQLRLYNFSKEPAGILTLGILHDGQVLKAGLTQIDSRLYSFTLEEGIEKLENAKALSCAVINFNKGQPTPILFGSSDGKAPTSTEIRLASTLSLFDESLDMTKTQNILDEYEIDYDDEEKVEIENLIDKEMSHSQNRIKTHSEEEKKEEPAPNKKGAFYEEVKNQISELFTNYPEEAFLTQIIPHSKWVRVDYEKNGHYYVVGLIYEEGILKYICYGMPGMWEEKPPKEMEGVSQWLPLDNEKPQDFGYWLSYQDADDGQNIEIEII